MQTTRRISASRRNGIQRLPIPGILFASILPQKNTCVKSLTAVFGVWYFTGVKHLSGEDKWQGHGDGYD